jgi:SAM-dependent methyltransferase
LNGDTDPLFDFTDLQSKATLEEYGRFQQHLVLIEDHRRVAQFARAIARFPPGRVVFDVGAGTGILSLIALKHGFERAYLVEPSRKIASYAQHLAKINGMADRITIIPSTLEGISPELIPYTIDLVVTETLSSLLFGFGCWDRLSEIADRLTNSEAMIPLKGNLFACLAARNYATRGPNTSGQAVLREIGLQIDLFELAFRSGGNVYDETDYRRDLQAEALISTRVAGFDFSRRPAIDLKGAQLVAPQDANYTGAVFHWEVTLTEQRGGVTLTSMDSQLTSWHPVYVPFSEPKCLRKGATLDLQLRLLPIDAPYTYAIQLVSGDAPLSRVLYW